MSVAEVLGHYRGKRVLVTGDTGFKGSWLSLWLSELGAKVYGLALPPETTRDHYVALGLDQRVNHVDCDIRDFSRLTEVVAEFKPEILFHLAAQPLVRKSYLEPRTTFETNVQGSVNVLEVVRTSESLRSVVYVTSDKCYQNREWFWGYRENDRLGGHDPYSASKAAAEVVLTSYQSSFFDTRNNLGVASARAGNVIGGGDWSQDRIIPDCIAALTNHRPIVLRNPSATRPWQHVLEPLYGYLALGQKLYEQPKKFSGAWNFGPNISSIRPVYDLAKAMVEAWGGGEVVVSEVGGPHEAQLLHLNCDKAKHGLGWDPLWNFQRTVALTTDWYKKFNGNAATLGVSLQQIQLYTEELTYRDLKETRRD